MATAARASAATTGGTELGQVAATSAGRRPGGIEDYESAPYVIKHEIGSVRLREAERMMKAVLIE
jgi:hypothetical protein